MIEDKAPLITELTEALEGLWLLTAQTMGLRQMQGAPELFVSANYRTVIEAGRLATRTRAKLANPLAKSQATALVRELTRALERLLRVVDAYDTGQGGDEFRSEAGAAIYQRARSTWEQVTGQEYQRERQGAA